WDRMNSRTIRARGDDEDQVPGFGSSAWGKESLVVRIWRGVRAADGGVSGLAVRAWDRPTITGNDTIRRRAWRQEAVESCRLNGLCICFRFAVAHAQHIDPSSGVLRRPEHSTSSG